MQFVREGDFYKVARITGAQYNFLAIRLGKAGSEIEVIPLPAGLDAPVKVDQAAVFSQVKSGLAFANRELEAQYFISCVQYMPSDTPSSWIYEVLTRELIRRIHSGWRD